ncbi:hypothetical protein DVH24_035994 [Malus domestica]|uniref:Uncharacterized protein n=1 Tax=Malus domestica TaxID=3750 RepID=A0A498JQK4_MALDO|nr:hypothetical protein DVH24_035994 [Malus domestica]
MDTLAQGLGSCVARTTIHQHTVWDLMQLEAEGTPQPHGLMSRGGVRETTGLGRYKRAHKRDELLIIEDNDLWVEAWLQAKARDDSMMGMPWMVTSFSVSKLGSRGFVVCSHDSG